jgi:hypothetical protein
LLSGNKAKSSKMNIDNLDNHSPDEKSFYCEPKSIFAQQKSSVFSDEKKSTVFASEKIRLSIAIQILQSINFKYGHHIPYELFSVCEIPDIDLTR